MLAYVQTLSILGFVNSYYFLCANTPKLLHVKTPFYYVAQLSARCFTNLKNGRQNWLSFF